MNADGIWTIVLKVYGSNKPLTAQQEIKMTSISQI